MKKSTNAENVELKSDFLSKIADKAGKVIAAKFLQYGELAEKWLEDRSSVCGNFDPHEKTRDDLIEAAKLGLLTCQLAEGLATKLGCKPFAYMPDYSDFDPKFETFWTLPMALAWIESRSFHSVIEQMDTFREEWWLWESTKNRGLPKDGKLNGYIVKHSYSTRPIGPADLGIMIGSSNGFFRKDLWRKLSEGEATATGKRNGNLRQTILPEFWQDLEPDNRENASLRGAGGEEWHDVTLRRDDVLRLWPESFLEIQKVEVPSKIPRRRIAKTPDLKKAYEKRVLNWPKDKKPPTREEDEQYMRDVHNLSRETTRDFRKQFAPLRWTKSGKRPNLA